MLDWRKKKVSRLGLIERTERDRWGLGPIQERTLLIHAEEARLRTRKQSMDEVAKNRAKRDTN